MTGPVAARLAEMVETASDGRLTAGEVLRSEGSLAALGLASLELLRLVDGIEDEFGVVLDLGGGAPLDGFPSLVGHVAENLR
ncbi:acyl carrier protein [Planomonospora sp. ID82291]|uniref:acyl carrier protein n=1 Tax=Planomonospora sp. ID82291 TaxID=2738136 RepID=UPI0018C3F8E8|nr:acyl carrier protein [Planomonospora sp. ID82291]MBG0818229.1 acyl carrier protein [Planomonospora sp. ID82291]